MFTKRKKRQGKINRRAPVQTQHALGLLGWVTQNRGRPSWREVSDVQRMALEGTQAASTRATMLPRYWFLGSSPSRNLLVKMRAFLTFYKCCASQCPAILHGVNVCAIFNVEKSNFCFCLVNFSTDVNALVEEIQKAEPLITASRSDQVKLLIQRLQTKLGQHSNHNFYLFKVRHVLKIRRNAFMNSLMFS